MTKTILCRADGNSKVGLGHLYRMLAIAEFYKDSYELVFLTKECSTSEVIPKDFSLSFIPKGISILEEPQWISNNFSSSDYIIIADGYQFTTNFQKEIKKHGFTLIYIDDLAEQKMYADVVVNHSPYSMLEHYNAEKYTQFAIGVSYSMLRPLFNEAAKTERIITNIDSAFVCFGGADQYDLSLKATKALINIEKFNNIEVVLGAAYRGEEIFKLEKNNNKLTLHKNLDESRLYSLMSSCNFAVVPSSTILYEICSVKMPVLSGYYVDNQKYIYNGLLNKNVFFKGEDFSKYKVLDFENKIKSILTINKLDVYTKNQQNLFQGNSKINFLGLLNRLNVSFRKATKDDLMLVYNWSNDPLVRNNSFNSEPIVLNQHRNWFATKIKDANTLFLIALVNNKPAGIIRYSIEDKYSLVSIMISKAFRGQKLAETFLKKSSVLYFKIEDKPVLAYIKNENIASVKAFENSGYQYFKEELIKNKISFLYKLNKKDVRE